MKASRSDGLPRALGSSGVFWVGLGEPGTAGPERSPVSAEGWICFSTDRQGSTGRVSEASRAEASRGAQSASRLITVEIFFVLGLPVSAFASKLSPAKARKCSSGLTFKRHLKQMT